jgi:3-deoxy-manno-octulosonate cytidylyltransferase (CMP-KDO synthetase)
MIEHVYRRTAAARGIDTTLVATDDERIAAAVARFGGEVRMTAATHRTGTDRIAEVARDLTCEIVVNVQGDLPLLEPEMLSELIQPLADDPSVVMSTLCCPADAADYRNPNVVKVVLDRRGDALYFSRSPIPFYRGGEGPPEGGPHIDGPPEGGPYQEGPPKGGPYIARDIGRDDAADAAEALRVGAGFSRPMKHIGLYGYRRDFLLMLAALPQTPLEQAESLEQLRVLEHGYRIRTVQTSHATIEVDTPDDLERVRRSVEALNARTFIATAST